MIIVTYTSMDRARRRRNFATLVAARRFAHYWVGAHPELAAHYAVSGDGIGKIEVRGCALRDLFPPPVGHRYAVFSHIEELRCGGEALAWYAQRDDGVVVGGPCATEAEAQDAVRRDRHGY